NVDQIPNLVDALESLLDLTDGERVLDLYAGVGIFSAALARRAALVTLVESYPPAVTDADLNLSDFDNVDVIEGGVETVLESLDENYDAAVIDPPSNGVPGAVINELKRLQVERIVYVSDDPATLARDSRRLAKAGYKLVVAQPIDLYPQTYYVDTLALYKNT